MTRARIVARGMFVATLVIGFGAGCSALGWGVANAAYAVGRYVGAH